MCFSVPGVRAAVAELRQRGVFFDEYDELALNTIDSVASINGDDSAWFRTARATSSSSSAPTSSVPGSVPARPRANQGTHGR